MKMSNKGKLCVRKIKWKAKEEMKKFLRFKWNLMIKDLFANDEEMN